MIERILPGGLSQLLLQVLYLVLPLLQGLRQQSHVLLRLGDPSAAGGSPAPARPSVRRSRAFGQPRFQLLDGRVLGRDDLAQLRHP